MTREEDTQEAQAVCRDEYVATFTTQVELRVPPQFKRLVVDAIELRDPAEFRAARRNVQMPQQVWVRIGVRPDGTLVLLETVPKPPL